MTSAHKTESEWRVLYDERAKRYGSQGITFGFVTPKTYDYRRTAILDALSSLHALFRNKRIADIGCGSGLITLPLREHNTLVGIDISPEMIRLARENGLHGAAASAGAVPLKNAHFDTAVAAGVIQHFADADTVVRECVRITKPGGHIIIETINSESIMRRLYRFFVRGDNLSSRPFKVSEITAAIDRAGVDLLKIVYLYYPLTYTWTYTSQRVTPTHRLLSSAFIVVGMKR